jgi:hypothetical protein
VTLLALLRHVELLAPTAATASDWDFAEPLWLDVHHRTPDQLEGT